MSSDPTEDHEAVIARLLDGWAPVVNETALSGWLDSYDVREPDRMTDGEARIMRRMLARRERR